MTALSCLCIDAKDVRQHFRNNSVEFVRDMIAQIEPRERFDELRVFVQRNAVLFGDSHDLFGHESPAGRDDLRRLGTDRIVLECGSGRTRRHFFAKIVEAHACRSKRRFTIDDDGAAADACETVGGATDAFIEETR